MPLASATPGLHALVLLRTVSPSRTRLPRPLPFPLELSHHPLAKLLVPIESMMGKFALLAALLVASAGALRNSDTPGKTHGDEAVFEIHDQQVIPQYHPSEHGQGNFVDDDDTTRLRSHSCWGVPTKLAYGGPWHPGPEFTNLTIYQVLSTNEQ